MLAAQRAIDGFQGPRDIFRNPLAIYRLNEPCQDGRSPFDLELGESGDAFAIRSMHFKLGLYEHQSASALQSLINLLAITPQIVKDLIDSILQLLLPFMSRLSQLSLIRLSGPTNQTVGRPFFTLYHCKDTTKSSVKVCRWISTLWLD